MLMVSGEARSGSLRKKAEGVGLRLQGQRKEGNQDSNPWSPGLSKEVAQSLGDR